MRMLSVMSRMESGTASATMVTKAMGRTVKEVSASALKAVRSMIMARKQ